jgi:hypothetical protein
MVGCVSCSSLYAFDGNDMLCIQRKSNSFDGSFVGQVVDFSSMPSSEDVVDFIAVCTFCILLADG